MASNSAEELANLLYTTPETDQRQGDIYRDVLHVMLPEPGFKVLRPISAKGTKDARAVHKHTDPEPSGGLDWAGRERVEAFGQLAFGIVLTHDCEIENDDNRHHRLIALMRPFDDSLSEESKEIIAAGRHFGRLYLPAWPAAGLPESYIDFRRITTVLNKALPVKQRVASLSDEGRDLLQRSFIAFVTELFRSQEGAPAG